MKTTFFDRQDLANPMSGISVSSAHELRSVLSSVRHRAPFFAELIGENGFKLLLGLAADEGCIQFSSVDGAAPYFMAVVPQAADSVGEISFLIGDTASPIPRRFSLPYETVVRVAETFVQTGQRSTDVGWEEI